MKFLHTSDWHIGKTLRGLRRHEEEQAVLAELLEIAREEQVDCLIVAGDIYDTTSPSSEAERIVYEFLRELWGVKIPAVIIAGNHDDPRRLAAASGILELAGIHIRADVTGEEASAVRLPSRDGSEEAVIATLPWVPERKAVPWESIARGEKGKPFEDYAARVAEGARFVCRPFTEDTVNLFVAHLLVDGAVVGPGGGERPLHITQTYAVSSESLPQNNVHYLALGHLHNSQEIVAPVPCRYSGSPLQLDFGERGQKKVVQIVDASPGRPALVEALPLTKGRSLREVRGSLPQLEAMAGEVNDDYLKVIVDVSAPVPNLAAQVREFMPNAVDVRADLPERPGSIDISDQMKLSPTELLAKYHKDAFGSDLPEEMGAFFRQLLEEVEGEAA